MELTPGIRKLYDLESSLGVPLFGQGSNQNAFHLITRKNPTIAPVPSHPLPPVPKPEEKGKEPYFPSSVGATKIHCDVCGVMAPCPYKIREEHYCSKRCKTAAEREKNPEVEEIDRPHGTPLWNREEIEDINIKVPPRASHSRKNSKRHRKHKYPLYQYNYQITEPAPSEASPPAPVFYHYCVSCRRLVTDTYYAHTVKGTRRIQYYCISCATSTIRSQSLLIHPV